MLTSMEVRFFRFRPWAAILSMDAEVPVVESASANHFLSKGINLHIFLKLNWRASNRQIVVWEKTLPYSVPNARPTSAWVNPNLIRLCLNCLAKDSRSSEKQASARYYYRYYSKGIRSCWYLRLCLKCVHILKQYIRPFQLVDRYKVKAVVANYIKFLS